MSPEMQGIFDKRMQPSRMHVLLAVEWFNVEDAVKACLIDLDEGRISCADIRPFMQSRFHTLKGLQQALVVANATMRVKVCYHDLMLLRDAA